MQIGGNTFKIDGNYVDQLSHKIANRLDKDDEQIKKRITQATEMVWRIAHQKRPMISKPQMKAEGRSYPVSDPSAQAGVPVQSGLLQSTIQQKVEKKALMSYQGEVRTQGIEYAGFVEYGTSKMAARPFMRPAINLTTDAIKRTMGAKIESNL